MNKLIRYSLYLGAVLVTAASIFDVAGEKPIAPWEADRGVRLRKSHGGIMGRRLNPEEHRWRYAKDQKPTGLSRRQFSSRSYAGVRNPNNSGGFGGPE